MSENHDKLLRAAIDTFARYGFRRTTMGDIAKAAGLSRPTLYARFPNKEEVLTAAIGAVGAQALQDLTARWAPATTAQQVLADYCDEMILKQYDMIKNMPDSAELFSGLTEGAQAALDELQDQHAQAMLAKLRSLYGQADVPEQAVGFFIAAAKGLKMVAVDREVLESHLGMLSDLLIARLEQHGA